MSAFCGVYSPRDPELASPEVLERMAASLRHVPPRSEHIQLDRDYFLTPMAGSDGRVSCASMAATRCTSPSCRVPSEAARSGWPPRPMG